MGVVRMESDGREIGTEYDRLKASKLAYKVASLGQAVMVKRSDGSWSVARVVAIDPSPESQQWLYTVEGPGEDGYWNKEVPGTDILVTQEMQQNLEDELEKAERDAQVKEAYRAGYISAKKDELLKKVLAEAQRRSAFEEAERRKKEQ